MTEEEVQSLLEELGAAETAFTQLNANTAAMAEDNGIYFEELTWLDALLSSGDIAVAFEAARNALEAALTEAQTPVQQALL